MPPPVSEQARRFLEEVHPHEPMLRAISRSMFSATAAGRNLFRLKKLKP